MDEVYEPVIGLEVHVQLATCTKAFSSESYFFGAEANTQISLVSLAHPGSLPIFNRAALDFGVKMGLACGCDISLYNSFARKNYFYADLPKGYQITQHETPLCRGGSIVIKNREGKEKKIRLTRIHLEEDTGKSIHDIDPFHTLLDFNRAGVPLIEIVSEPDFCSGEEAYQYLYKVRRLVRYLDISNGNMEEGSLRCDVNISIRKKGEKTLGTKVEVKNMNSFSQVQKAIDYEIKRQTIAVNKGKKIKQETRFWSAPEQKTILMRTKEQAKDYRYFTEPDLPPILLSEKEIQRIKESLPMLPEDREIHYQKNYALSEKEAILLSEEKETSHYFESLCQVGISPKKASNWMLGPIRFYLNQKGISLEKFPFTSSQIKDAHHLVEEGLLSFSNVAKVLLAWEENASTSPLEVVKKLGFLIEDNTEETVSIVREILATYPEKVDAYQKGQKGLLGFFMGEIMKKNKTADPKKTNELLQHFLDK